MHKTLSGIYMHVHVTKQSVLVLNQPCMSYQDNRLHIISLPNIIWRICIKEYDFDICRLFFSTTLLLTPSLLWCHLKTTDESSKLKTLCLLFLYWHVKGFSSKCIALKADVLQDRKIYCLQACACIFQPGNLTGWGREGVND